MDLQVRKKVGTQRALVELDGHHVGSSLPRRRVYMGSCKSLDALNMTTPPTIHIPSDEETAGEGALAVKQPCTIAAGARASSRHTQLDSTSSKGTKRNKNQIQLPQPYVPVSSMPSKHIVLSLKSEGSTPVESSLCSAS
ncbi:hypothetical protein PIB30_045372 [Stylosanthes scabra]|uniref:Uncharacterized protein n=1 Tax=Stylosanthes scabra TaxID=79078 RepID=A0ABU6TGU3_9FABA|nr:hypothetical protein [Stylosanthes scabra]